MPHTYEHPRPMLTVDAVVVEGRRYDPRRVLLIRRRDDPFEGKWALPGGFVEEGESPRDACLRELEEETGVRLDYVAQVGAFGDPGRDPRGWCVSVAYVGHVAKGDVKPAAADDAAEVEWFPLHDLPDMAFDHLKIVTAATAR